MATIISSKSNQFRYVGRIFYSQILRPSRSTTLSPPSPSPNHLHRSNLPFHQLVGPQGYGDGSLLLCQRFLSNAAAGSVNQEKPASDGSAKDNSDQGKESGESNQKADAGKPVRGGPVSWLSFLLLVATGAGLIYYYDGEKKRHIEEINSASKAVKEGPSAGQAAIGGPFNLINHDGRRVTEKNFLGNWTLIYFGFTHCPDICPDELIKLAAAVDKIKEKSGLEIVPIFISVDPERDTVEQVREYVKEFHPRLIGLTGSSEEIRNVARAYRVYYMKTAEEDSDYLVDHSIVMYLMGPDMQFVKFFGKNNDVDSLTDGIIKEVKKYTKK
ncbi:protein SCO1 homolog 1, mitochondrial [Prosopis cineraria]|uniref:protein SCO1 homolog 1, mitochondrial n=1 Tax=Prosopis cineraria TaxID=364024 RepID=UPI00240F28CC|nr:protein SCO1 homolog 1, mitochondrial [Prosopis cineraria]